jgi:flavin reductase (DIM6/NTAB) family NADH-FMN oxidoreductase RutF
MDNATAKQALRLFSYGLYVATTADEAGETGAMLVNWVGQVSFEPRMLSLAVENTSHFLGVLRNSGVFAINVVESSQRELAGHFGKSTFKAGNKLEGYRWNPGSTGSPILDGLLGAVECRVVSEHPAGDHVLFIAEVVDAHFNREGDPLTMREAGFRYSG